MLCLGLICSGRWGTATMACPKQRPAPRTRTGEKSAGEIFKVTQEQNLPGVRPRPPQAYGLVPPFLHTSTHQKKRQKKANRLQPCIPSSVLGQAVLLHWKAPSCSQHPLVAEAHPPCQGSPRAAGAPRSAAIPHFCTCCFPVTSTVLRARPHLSPRPPSCPTDPGHGDKWTSGRGHPDPSPNVNPPRLGYPRCRIGRNKRSASREGLEDLISWLLALGNYCCMARPNYAAINFSSREIR